MPARFYPVALLIGFAAQALGQAQPTPQNSRLIAYFSFFTRVSFSECGPGTRDNIAYEFKLTESEMNAVCEISADWRAKFKAFSNQISSLPAGGQSMEISSAIRDVGQARNKMTFDHIDQLQAALGPERFAALDDLITKPRPPLSPEALDRAARAYRFHALFVRVSWLQERIAWVALRGKVGPLTLSAPAREFGLSAAEQALVTTIVADWKAKNSDITSQSRIVRADGRTTLYESPKIKDAREKNDSDQMDRLQAALGPKRFAALDARLNDPAKPITTRRSLTKLNVVEVDGKTVSLSFAGIRYRSPGPPPQLPQHYLDLIVYTRDGIEEFGWEEIRRVEIRGGRATITLRTGKTVSGAEFPPSSLDGVPDGETAPGQKSAIDFSKIKTITVSLIEPA